MFEKNYCIFKITYQIIFLIQVMTNSLLVLFFIFLFLIIIFLVFRYKKPFNKSRETKSVTRLIPAASEEEYNPDINTKNWDLHKNRLTKFGRSQYKGLTFFVSSEDRIYYLSTKGNKVYC